MRQTWRKFSGFWRRGTRPLFSGAVLGLMASWLFAALVVLPAVWPAAVEAQSTSSSQDNDLFCFTPAECSPEMINESACTSGSGCCAEDRCFLVGEGCPQGEDTKDRQGKCYAKSPPIQLTISLGGTDRVLDIGDYIEAAYQYGIGIVVFLAGVMIMIGGLMYLTAGDSGRVAQAKGLIVDSLLGLAVALSAYVLLNTINPQLLSLELPKIPIVKTENFVGCDLTKMCRPCGEKYGLTNEFAQLAVKGNVDGGIPKNINICDTRYVVDSSDGSKVVTCVGGGCACSSDGKCSDANYTCRKPDQVPGQSAGGIGAGSAVAEQAAQQAATQQCPVPAAQASPETDNYGCFQCKSNGYPCGINGPDASCCSGFCAGDRCTGGRPGDPCGKDFFYVLTNPGVACQSGLCETQWFNSCSTGLEGSQCASASECRNGLKCQTKGENFCATGTAMTMCSSNSECASGHTCVAVETDTDGARDIDSKLCVPERLAAPGWLPSINLSRVRTSYYVFWSTQTKETIRYDLGFGASDNASVNRTGLPCQWNENCTDEINPALARLGISLGLKYCVRPEARGIGFCTTGVTGSPCSNWQDCAPISGGHRFCVKEGSSKIGRCSTGINGAWCYNNSHCQSGLCYIGNQANICVAGDLGGLCATNANEKTGLRCKTGMVCQGSGDKAMCVFAEADQCKGKAKSQ